MPYSLTYHIEHGQSIPLNVFVLRYFFHTFGLPLLFSIINRYRYVLCLELIYFFLTHCDVFSTTKQLSNSHNKNTTPATPDQATMTAIAPLYLPFYLVSVALFIKETFLAHTDTLSLKLHPHLIVFRPKETSFIEKVRTKLFTDESPTKPTPDPQIRTRIRHSICYVHNMLPTTMSA